MQVTNKYCTLSSLISESDVEQHFLMPFFKDLGYDDRKIATKTYITVENVGKGNRKKFYSPDYIIYRDNKRTDPIIIVDAKSPKVPAQEGVEDAELYTFVMRKKMKGEDRAKPFCIGCNGLTFIVKGYESDSASLQLTFEDFVEGNLKFQELKNLISIDATKQDKDKKPKSDEFNYEKPDVAELEGIFRACHDKIWKKEKIKPTEAFYEFSKLFFLKLYNDREIHKKILDGSPITKEDVFFSEDYIRRQNKQHIENPFNILFDNLKKELKKEIDLNNKKIIFESNEKIDLKPSTILEVVKLLEHLDLHGIDEDLNGRMFESFLNATVRGKDLGQFFTPRTVVKFMVKMVDISVSNNQVETVLDGLCGSGGFLIESMAQMFEKINLKKNLSDEERRELK